MKKILIVMAITLSFIFSSELNFVNASFFWDSWRDLKTWICENWECSLSKWISKSKVWIIGIETERWFSDYVQDIVAYALKFLYMIAVIMIIYAWYLLLVSAWNFDEMSKAKNNIVLVLLWIIVIYLADSIVNFLVDAISK